MSLVYVMALIDAQPGREDDLEATLKTVVPKVRAEEGCIRYDLHREAKGKPRFMFYEIWESPEALKAHSQAPHMTEMRGQVKDMVTGPTEVTIWGAADVA